MYFIIFMIAPVAILALIAVSAYMLINASRDEPAADLMDYRMAWRPPLARGKRLAAWGARRSEAMTRRLLAQPRTAETAAKVAKEIQTAASFAIHNLPDLSQHPQAISCQFAAFRQVRVSAPEVFAIADKIRTNTEQSRRIHDLALSNAERLAQFNHDGGKSINSQCPLRTSDGMCVAEELCPLDCRFCHPFEEDALQQVEKSVRSSFADLESGIMDGLSRGLKDAGVDGHIYELNESLAVALEIPDASQRWARGENVLASHRPG